MTRHTLSVLVENNVNPATGSVYLILFHTPAGRWGKDWPVAAPILDRLGLDTGS